MEEQSKSELEATAGEADKKGLAVLIFMTPVAAVLSAIAGAVIFGVIYGICNVLGVIISGGSRLQGIGAFIARGGPVWGMFGWVFATAVVTGKCFIDFYQKGRLICLRTSESY